MRLFRFIPDLTASEYTGRWAGDAGRVLSAAGWGLALGSGRFSDQSA
jgi:hypothetical protein